MDELLAIGEFSERSGLSARRLRAYAASGLLVPAAVDAESGYRYYAPGQLSVARLIEQLRFAGIGTREIAAFLAAPSDAALRDWEREIEDEHARRAAALDAVRAALALEPPPVTHPVENRPQEDAMFVLNGAAATRIGRGRPVNQDGFLVESGFAAVADGMGGAPAGERAARLALDSFATNVAAAPGPALDHAAARANDDVWQAARSDRDLAGMGTTICAVAVADDALAFVSVGDSRAYLLRDRSLEQVTTDHNVATELVQRGEVEPAAVRSHPHRHVLTRALGVAPSVEPDTRLLPARDGDRVLLCTDGVTLLDDDEILRILTTVPDPTTAAEDLVDRAVAAGSDDDATAVVVSVDRRHDLPSAG